MDIRNVYKLGSMTEIKSIKSPTRATAIVYTKGKDLVTKLLKKGNCTLPRKQVYELAGVIETTDLNQVFACCFAKGLYDRVNEIRSQATTPIKVSKILNDYEDELHKTSGMLLINSIASGSTQDIRKDFITLSAKNFLKLPVETQEKALASLTQNFDDPQFEM